MERPVPRAASVMATSGAWRSAYLNVSKILKTLSQMSDRMISFDATMKSAAVIMRTRIHVFSIQNPPLMFPDVQVSAIKPIYAL